MIPACNLKSWNEWIQLIKGMIRLFLAGLWGEKGFMKVSLRTRCQLLWNKLYSYSQLTWTWLTAGHHIYNSGGTEWALPKITSLSWFWKSEECDSNMETMAFTCRECEHIKRDFMAIPEHIYWLLIYWHLLVWGFSNILAKGDFILYSNNQPESQYQTESTLHFESKGFVSCFNKMRQNESKAMLAALRGRHNKLASIS